MGKFSGYVLLTAARVSTAIQRLRLYGNSGFANAPHCYVKHTSFLFNVTTRWVDRCSSVGIAPRCALDGPGIESRWRRDFLHPFRPALGPIQPCVKGYGVIPTLSGAEVKERVELNLYSSSVPSWPVLE
jgi:hypothetical protein